MSKQRIHQEKTKRPLDIDLAIRRIRESVKDFAKAAMFALAELGYDSPFEQLIACIISIRTYDEVMLPTAQRLFEQARTPKEMARLTPDEIDKLISTCTFHEPKAKQIHAIAVRCVDEF